MIRSVVDWPSSRLRFLAYQMRNQSLFVYHGDPNGLFGEASSNVVFQDCPMVPDLLFKQYKSSLGRKPLADRAKHKREMTLRLEK